MSACAALRKSQQSLLHLAMQQPVAFGRILSRQPSPTTLTHTKMPTYRVLANPTKPPTFSPANIHLENIPTRKKYLSIRWNTCTQESKCSLPDTKKSQKSHQTDLRTGCHYVRTNNPTGSKTAQQQHRVWIKSLIRSRNQFWDILIHKTRCHTKKSTLSGSDLQRQYDRSESLRNYCGLM